tara:strand:+ start:159 stop:491 length:333 start_codon:yes stop_codon:yes gene_type:complete
MRLYEFQNTDKELESALVNTLMNVTGDADDKNRSAEISFDAVQQIMRNAGYPAFNYDLFKRLYDAGETLKNIVKDFDNEKIVLKTDTKIHRISYYWQSKKFRSLINHRRG